ncbi:hypothetical protein ILUMI_09126 [Ignelater luminosus]|uniref:Aminopeptidase n=1 Tax=Ignelater luminosus TaxID=2038154 RepID=A0A8K0D4U9_IGNLU|nr:hypothetical protein ILUMI_09126 [Ignelater luminosus]
MIRFVFVLLFSVTLCSIVSCQVYRLPKNVKPLRYFLTMEPHLRDTDLQKTFHYDGNVKIELEVLEDTKSITLHQLQLRIDNTTIELVNSNGKENIVVDTSKDGRNETYTIHFGELVEIGIYNLTIGNFSGELGDGEGFFHAVYFKEPGKPRSLAVTHFEPTGARLAFPCFDEPALKAKFIVSLIRREGYISVSNENLDMTENLGDGRFKDTFKETPIMSTFTLAFAVCDYEATEKVERQRVYANSKAIKNGEADYALHTGIKSLKLLEEFTGIDFVLDKLDQFAVPDAYFYEHAMENWGLVIYGQSNLLRSNSSPAEDFKRTTSYIAHEYAHQWFGNLVTAAWWDYLWICESFASYFQYYIASLVQPSWRLMDQFVIDMLHTALKQEELRGEHPLNYRIRYSGQYPPFHIMYEKGASIIRMMEHFLTHEVFRRGIQIYLETNKFTATVPKDLYNAFQQAVNKAGVNNLLNNMTVREIMEVWDSTKGFPIVTVKRDYRTGEITLEQKSQFDDVDDITTSKWIIPINFLFSSDEQFDFSKTSADLWLTEKTATINRNFSTDGLVIVNKQQTGYYRVNYDLENWEEIIKFMNSENFTLIHVLNRAQLINDAFNLARLEEIPWDVPFRLGEYIIREKDCIPLAAFYDTISNNVFIYSFLDRKAKESQYFKNYTLPNAVPSEDSSEYYIYKEYLKAVLRGVSERLGFKSKPNDTHIDQLHRDKFIRFRSILEDTN